uniref:Uncharacterized protein n=1 Tax=Heliothis virescens TaxID=7102 RepID=A0A2A4JU12_HELVI
MTRRIDEDDDSEEENQSESEPEDHIEAYETEGDDEVSTVNEEKFSAENYEISDLISSRSKIKEKKCHMSLHKANNV